jgi:hypothetical protein
MDAWSIIGFVILCYLLAVGGLFVIEFFKERMRD